MGNGSGNGGGGNCTRIDVGTGLKNHYPSLYLALPLGNITPNMSVQPAS